MLGARPSHWSEYLHLVRWLAPDVFRHARSKMIRMLALSGVGAGLRAASAGVIVLFVDAQQSGEPVRILDWALPSAPTPFNLLLWGSAGLVFTFGAVLASYRCDRLVFELAQTYAEDWSRVVLRHVARGGVVRIAGTEQRSGPRATARLVAASSLQLVRVVIAALSIVLPAITGIAAIGVLVATQPLLTAILIPIGIGYAWAIGRIQRRTLRDVEKRIERTRESRRDTLRMMSALQRQRFPRGSEPRWLGEYPRRSAMAAAIDAYRSVLFVRRRVGYLGDLFQGVSLLLILLVFGSVMANGNASWTVLLTYAVALGFAVRSWSTASKFATTVNRLLPKVRRYLDFIRRTPDLASEPSDRVAVPGDAWPSFEIARPALPGSAARCAPQPGEPVFCIHPVRLENVALADFCSALANGDPDGARVLTGELFAVQGLGMLPERRLVEHLPPHPEPDAQEREVRAVLEALGVEAELASVQEDPDRPLAMADEERLSAALRLALRLLPGLLSSRRLVALDYETFELLDAAARRRLVEALADRVILLTASRAPKSLAPEVGRTLVVGLDAVQGTGDVAWFEAVARPVVAEWTEASQGLETEEDDGLMGDDAEEDDE